MSSAAVRLASPTLSDRALLEVARRLTAFVEHRTQVRAERRDAALERLRERQSAPYEPPAIEQLFARDGVPRR